MLQYNSQEQPTTVNHRYARPTRLRTHKKSRNGCPQCRLKKIKCDETLPGCQRCLLKDIRCGYLDYDQKQIDKIRLAHWEQSGSDPTKYPFEKQHFQPGVPLEVFHKNPVEFNKLGPPLSTNNSSHNNNNNNVLINRNINFSNEHINDVDYQLFVNHHQKLHHHTYHPCAHNSNNINYNYIHDYTYLTNGPSPNCSFDEQSLNVLSSPESSSESAANHLFTRPSTSTSHLSTSFDAQSLLFSTFNASTEPSSPANIDSLSYNFELSPNIKQLDVNTNYLSPHIFELDDIVDINQSKVESFNIPLIKHSFKPTMSLQNKDHSIPNTPSLLNNSNINSSINNFDEDYSPSRVCFIQSLFDHSQFYNNKINNQSLYPLFNSSLLISYGQFLSKHPEFKSLFLNIKSYSINYILKESSKINNPINNNINVDQLIKISILLEVSSIFQNNLPMNDQLSQFLTLSIGPISILQQYAYSCCKTSQINTHHSSTRLNSNLESIGDFLFFNSNFMSLIPSYDSNILNEFFSIITRFGNEFIIESDNNHLKQKYFDLVEFLEISSSILSTTDSTPSIENVYKLVQKWIDIFPSECTILDSSKDYLNKIEKIFYSLWLTLFKILESIIGNTCRYNFSFFIDGFDLYIRNFNRQDIDKLLSGSSSQDNQLKWYFNYSCRVMSFLTRRISIHLALIYNKLNNDIGTTITEDIIKSFENTIIKKNHYPRLSFQDQDYLSEYISIDGVDNDEATFDDIDFVNNVDPKTSLLKNDYIPDIPSFKDNTNSSKIIKTLPESTKLKFINKQILDRKLLLSEHLKR